MKRLHTFLVTAILLLCLFTLIGATKKAYADTSPYRSAGWVESVGNPPFINLGNCTETDQKFCSHIGQISGAAALVFGSFPDLESFGIPLNSTLDKINLRVKGKSTINHLVLIDPKYNDKLLSQRCEKPNNLINFNLGPADKTMELSFPLTSGNGLINCITQNNINYRNLTFGIYQVGSTIWSTDIDNFEIAFDYTPPAVTPAPVVFQEGQKGTVWEIGRDKSELKYVESLENVELVASGYEFSAALKRDGSVWTWTETNKTPKQLKGENGVGFLSDAKKIVAGGNFGLALKSDGTLWEWTQTSEGPQTPVKNNSLGNLPITDIAAGRAHKLALRSDGIVFGWGLNTDGQVGIGCTGGNCSTVSGPRIIDNFNEVASIAAGSSHSLAVKKDGTVWGWGAQSLGQLGENNSGNYADRLSPTQINELSDIKQISSKVNYNLAIKNSGQLIEWGESFELRKPRLVSGLTNANSISAGHTFGVLGHVIREDGTLWQLYINDISPKQVPVLKKVIAIASGEPSLAVVSSSGDVLGDSTGPAPFLDLPWDYGDGNFEKQALNPESWFDHKYPLQNVWPLTFKVLKYTGGKDADDAYRSHSGYDYALNNGVKLGTPVLAAASGSATFVPAAQSGGAGHMIKIDHGNGYQTWYEHLQYDGLITTSGAVSVAKREQVGKVGMTGRTNGPHIHFSVFKDANNNGNFNDDYPFGLVDPLGWEGDTPDPWTEYKVGEHSGAASVNLFEQRAMPIKNSISTSGGALVGPNIKVEVPNGATSVPFTLSYKDGPFESASATLKSITPSFYLTATNSLGDEIENFFKTVKIIYKYATSDIVVFKEGTLKMYNYNPDTEKWEEIPSSLDTEKKEITAETTHFSHFAVMGELKDTVAPNTEVKVAGDGLGNWYRSDVRVTLNGVDNDEGLGLEYTLYAIENDDWREYNSTLEFNSEGSHKLTYQSIDKANNKEVRKSLDVKIDKTAPSTSATISGTLGLEDWHTSDVNVNLKAEDAASGISKIEYSLDGGKVYQKYEGGFVLSKEGLSEISYRSVDKAGNVEEAKKMNVKIDKIAPSSVVYASGLRGENNWYRSNVEIGLNGSDDTSGYKTSYYSLDNGESYREVDEPIIFNAEGTHRIYYYSVDKAGNKEEHKSIEIKIDKTSPVVLITANPATLWPANGKMVNIKIGGKVDEENLFKTLFNITDEYNLIEPVLAGFDQTIKLEAKRNGNDRDGRMYSIVANADDLAGNQGSAQVQIIVPHDQKN